MSEPQYITAPDGEKIPIAGPPQSEKLPELGAENGGGRTFVPTIDPGDAGDTTLDALVGARKSAMLGWDDEALAGLKTGGGTWGDYQKERDALRQRYILAMRRSPVATRVGEVGGAVATSLVPGMAAGRGLVAGAKMGAALGAVQGVGNTDVEGTASVGQMTAQGLAGGLAGAVVGGATGGAAKALTGGYAQGAQRVADESLVRQTHIPMTKADVSRGGVARTAESLRRNEVGTGLSGPATIKEQAREAAERLNAKRAAISDETTAGGAPGLVNRGAVLREIADRRKNLRGDSLPADATADRLLRKAAREFTPPAREPAVRAEYTPPPPATVRKPAEYDGSIPAEVMPNGWRLPPPVEAPTARQLVAGSPAPRQLGHGAGEPATVRVRDLGEAAGDEGIAFKEVEHWKKRLSASYEKAKPAASEAEKRALNDIAASELAAAADRVRPGAGSEYLTHNKDLSAVLDAEAHSRRVWAHGTDKGISQYIPSRAARVLGSMGSSLYGAESGIAGGVAAVQRPLAAAAGAVERTVERVPGGGLLNRLAKAAPHPYARQSALGSMFQPSPGEEGVDYVQRKALESPDAGAAAHYAESITNPDYRAVMHDNK